MDNDENFEKSENIENFESVESVENNENKENNENNENIENIQNLLPSTPEPSQKDTKFYDNLRTVIKTQENILTMTCMAKEKIKYANEISVDQLKIFKENSLKYGKYLKLIHEELQMVNDLMKKIKRDVIISNTQGNAN